MLLAMSLAQDACHKKPTVAATPLPSPPVAKPEPPPDPEPAPPPVPTPPPVDYFQRGEELFGGGDYARAAEAYEKFLYDSPTEKHKDQALFQLAIIYAVPGSPTHDLQKAILLLKRVAANFPESPWKAQAQLILDLQADVDRLKSETKEKDERIRDRNERIREMEERIVRLTSELEKLKKIDMERRPTRPPQ